MPSFSNKQIKKKKIDGERFIVSKHRKLIRNLLSKNPGWNRFVHSFVHALNRKIKKQMARMVLWVSNKTRWRMANSQFLCFY